MAKHCPESRVGRTADNTEPWIFGSGTESLASALYLIRDAKVHPSNVHVLDKHQFSERNSHCMGCPSGGYDQSAACLPVPVGLPMERLLAMVHSAQSSQQHSFLNEIRREENTKLSAKKGARTCFLALTKGLVKQIPTDTLNLSLKQRRSLIRLFFKREKYLSQKRVKDLFPKNFFQSSFWIIWSNQYVSTNHSTAYPLRFSYLIRFNFQPWHSAAEFKRSLRQYLPQFQSSSIIGCLGITGYYQYEFLYLPVYFFLSSCGVDFRFGIEVKDLQMTNDNSERRVTGFSLVQDNLELRKQLGENDIVIITIGSTISGSAVGTKYSAPVWQSLNVDDDLDQNWSIWLDLANKSAGLDNPYNFCTRQTESMLESFTITTQEPGLYEGLQSLSKCKSEAGAFISLCDSNWKLNLCVPSQPAFAEQARDVRVLWGFAQSPRVEGNYVKRKMLHCSGDDILCEILGHLNIYCNPPLTQIVTIPRVMPRMSSLFLTRTVTSNVGLVGPFTDFPLYTCADISYGIRTAKTAVHELMGIEKDLEDSLEPKTSIIWTILFRR
ncbi:hypothetical protein N7451_012911 [Penicillium sp. IBT 35674x]|nr:hypothetical protein N7451_012911 [Penicillium sp. IBT 35674x]